MAADESTAALSAGGKSPPPCTTSHSLDDGRARAADGQAKTRLALILPKHRLWQWHRGLVQRLEDNHDIAVYLDDRASPYGRAIRLWLKLEQLVFPGLALARPVAPDGDWRPVADLEDISGQIVINLAEHPQLNAGAIELRYNDVPDSRALIGGLLSRQPPRLAAYCPSENKLLAASRLALEDKFSIQRGLEESFSRCLSLIVRALSASGSPACVETSAAATSNNATLIDFAPRMIARNVANLLMRPFRRREHWQVALRHGARPFNVVPDDGNRFYADPFLHRVGGHTFLFVEEYSYADRRGIISAAEVIDGRLAAPPLAVLRRPYHLSYPFVFESGGEVWMIPETSGNRSIELYRATEFPWSWERSKVLMDGAVFSDATILFRDGLWWLFVTADWFGDSTQDELSIFYSETLQGEWKPHQDNPVKSDSRFSRPAGRIIDNNGRLFRPAQDCERTYGAGIVWFEITELTPTRFRERQVAHWDGQAELGMDGLHSFDQIGPLQALDFKRAVYRGVARRTVATVTPRPGGAFERAFSGPSRFLEFDQG
ncbi:MAG: hypothetical protein M9932_19335 [Xanthobacteraceae bacterium]|nr:hypothetical protein [Xanthobacteraceae bacterium]